MTVDQRIAELEKKLTTPKWEYTGDEFNAKCYSPISVEESLWLVDYIKACREERGLPPKIEDLSHTIEFEDDE